MKASYLLDAQAQSEAEHFIRSVSHGKRLTPRERARLTWLLIDNHMRCMRDEAKGTLYGTITETELGMPQASMSFFEEDELDYHLSDIEP